MDSKGLAALQFKQLYGVARWIVHEDLTPTVMVHGTDLFNDRLKEWEDFNCNRPHGSLDGQTRSSDYDRRASGVSAVRQWRN